MADGEAICRHIIYSRKYITERFGKRVQPEIMWSPDTFGHPVTIPTILNHAGIKNYYLMRAGYRYSAGGFKYPLFLWKGPDGGKVLVLNSLYNNQITPEKVCQVAVEFEKRYSLKESIFVYGVGDHGGGPTRKDIERKRRLEQKPAIPNLVFSTTKRFFTLVRNKKDYPVVKEELNPIFEGCYTTHGDIKKANRNCENSLLALETFSVLANLLGKRYPEKELEEWWRIALFNQFHDILCGSAISESYRYSLKLANRVSFDSQKLITETLNYLSESVDTTGEGYPIIIFNHLGWERSEVVEFELPQQLRGKKVWAEDRGGKKFPVQEIGKKALFFAWKIPAFGYKTFWLKEANRREKENTPVIFGSIEEGFLETELYRMELGLDTGTIRRLYDKKRGREVLQRCSSVAEDPSSWWAEYSGNLLRLFHERPHPMSAWIIGNIFRIEHLFDREEMKLLEFGPVRWIVSVKRKYNYSRIEQQTILYPNLPWVDFKVIIDWQEKGSIYQGVPMLRVNFRTAFKNPRAEFEIPFGWQDRTGEGRELPSLKAVSLSEAGYRVCLLNREKYGYLVEGNNLSLTLLRSSYEPDSLPDVGEHKIDYRLLFGRIDKSELTRQAISYNRSLFVCVARVHSGRLPCEHSFLQFHSKNCVPTSLKKSLDQKGLILRFYEVNGKKDKVSLRFYFPVKGLWQSNLLEEKGRRVSLNLKKKPLMLGINPRSLNTLKIRTE